jgi:hypothetical protein
LVDSGLLILFEHQLSVADALFGLFFRSDDLGPILNTRFLAQPVSWAICSGVGFSLSLMVASF